MVSRLASVGILVALVFLSSPAAAIPPPMSSDELMARSDVVALVRVLSVTCTAVEQGRTWSGGPVGSYTAELELVEVRKGRVEPGEKLTVTFKTLPEGLAGPWTVLYFPGQEVWTHLRGGADGYTTTWWNAADQVVRPPDTTELPGSPGETIRAH